MSEVIAISPPAAKTGRVRLARFGLVIGPVLLIAGLATGLGVSQHQSRAGVENRFAARGAMH